MIPEAAIDHVEVLLDGAAAQYGTDAIAGVVNIILKKKSSGGSLSATVGDYYNRGDQQRRARATSTTTCRTIWACLCSTRASSTSRSRSSISNFTQYGGADNRYVNAQGNPVAQSTVTSVGANRRRQPVGRGNGIPNSFLPGVTGYPRSNPIDGNPEQQLTMARNECRL